MFRGLDHQVSSIYLAISHAHIGCQAQRLVAETHRDRPDQMAADRVAAYQLPPSERAGNPAFAQAELVASYAALHQTSSLGLNYNSPPSVMDDDMRERWACKLAEPGGFAEIDRQITTTVRLIDARTVRVGRGVPPPLDAAPPEADAPPQDGGRVPPRRHGADHLDTPPPPGGPGTPGGGSGDSTPPPPSHAR